jgi:hypothetical protein
MYYCFLRAKAQEMFHKGGTTIVLIKLEALCWFRFIKKPACMLFDEAKQDNEMT